MDSGKDKYFVMLVNYDLVNCWLKSFQSKRSNKKVDSSEQKIKFVI
jgi:hypothetical protein